MIFFSVLWFLFFYWVASINSVQAPVVQLSTFCSSRLSFRLVFDNLSKKVDVSPQDLDVAIISNLLFTTIHPIIEV